MAEEKNMTIREALSTALRDEMIRDERVFIMGEEVGVWGGTYAVTRGFYDEFGAKRVRDTPISEMVIAGAAVGAAMAGLTFSTGIAGGLLGGDFSLVRPSVQYRHYIPDKWLSGGHNIFAFNFQGQYIQSYHNSSVPFFDRFFIGGENTIRGFDIRSISPIAISSSPLYDPKGNPIIDLKTGLPQISEPIPTPVGGDTVGIFNFEYRIPIAGPLAVAAFFDAGIDRVTRKESLGTFASGTVEILGDANNKVRSSTGIEIQFTLPVVNAPFRLIFAHNPTRLDETVRIGTRNYNLKESANDIKFTVGRSF